MGHSKRVSIFVHIMFTELYRVIAYQSQVNVIAMSNHSKVFLQLIVITLSGDKKYLTKHCEYAYH